MTYLERQRRFNSLIASPIITMHWWKRRSVRQGIDLPAPALALPGFPTLFDFDINDLFSSYSSSDDLEKALIRRTVSCDSFDSHTSTLRATSSYAGLPASKVTDTPPILPPKRYARIFRHLRLTVFTVYRRIFSLILIANAIGLYLILRTPTQGISLNSLATWASTNLLVSVLARQDFFVNFIFRTAWLVPWAFPLRMRCMVARVYTYGGIHSGAAVAGTLWFLTFTTILTTRFIQQGQYTIPLLVLTFLILALLVSVCVLAFPGLRARYHNAFELTHRFMGWASIGLFWAQLLLLIQHTSLDATASVNVSFATSLARTPTFWNLLLMTGLLIYPWLYLRRWIFTVEILSSHALRLHFEYPIHCFSCLSISTSPMKEWHPFATFPSRNPGESGGSMVVSAAGDWTRALIVSQSETRIHAQTPGSQFSSPAVCRELKLWARTTSHPGVLSLSCIFPRVILLCTGSGIGPALSSLLDKPPAQFARLIWSTRSPLLTYGAKLQIEVQKADPDALVLDTDLIGRPNLTEVAYRMWRECRAEAVFVLSNADVTRKVVYGLESRNVPAFGPIWDS